MAMNTAKWLPLESEEHAAVFAQCKDLECATMGLIIKVTSVENTWTSRADRRCNGKNYVENLDYMKALEAIRTTLSRLVKCYFQSNPKINRIAPAENLILSHKKNLIMEMLSKKRFTLCYLIYNLVMSVFKSCMQRDEQSALLEIIFGLATLYNEITSLSSKAFVSKFNVCSNTCPILIHQSKKISMTKLLQVLAQGRSEICCHSLIDCLLSSYKPCNPNDVDAYSDNSSMEIYQALTKHLTPPSNQPEQKIDHDGEKGKILHKRHSTEKKAAHEKYKMEEKSIPENTEDINSAPTREPSQESDDERGSTPDEYYDETDDTCYSREISSLDKLIQREEMCVDVILECALKHAPTILGNTGIKKMKSGEYRVNRQLAENIVEYYQTNLWGHVGGFLEHIVLWWGASPLACRPPHSSQHLREWLISLNSNEVPQMMLIALQSLADALGCHVTSTSWDKLFRQCFVAGLQAVPVKSDLYPALSIKEVGACFADMFLDLITLSNQCEVTNDYIMGAPVDELPLVEQIPNLHRLDHSVHTYRLWCLAETRKLANVWDVDSFFRIVQNDVQMCLEQLSNLRFADHTVAIDSGKLGVQEYVCAKMREKLVSEIKANVEKLKKTPEECIQVLASICATTSLAHLTMIFPSHRLWKAITRPAKNSRSKYVHQYLDRVLLPVVKATSDKIIVNMVLKIMCESWLQHIYVYKIKFSNAAAEQLLMDFDAVRTWLTECQAISEITRRQMLNNEVLRRCEGVGKLLLHSPGDPISMHDVPQNNQRAQSQPDVDDPEDCGEIMPAEMYVPNQQQWLQLRTSKNKKRRRFCCVTLTY